MNSHLTVAVAQLNCRDDQDDNLATCSRLCQDAKAAGADWIAFPENATFIGHGPDKLERAEPIDAATAQAFSTMASDNELVVFCGSIVEQGTVEGKTFNTSLVFGRDGSRLAVYRKVHLFDAKVDAATSLVESKTVQPGTDLVVVEVDGFKVGLSICYDLRFPELFRALRADGADVLMVPAAFTERTGRDHWEVLLRARAIENQCWLVAADQWGPHVGSRVSYGHSMIIDPWGTVTARMHDGVGLALTRISKERLNEVRRRMPCWEHRKL